MQDLTNRSRVQAYLDRVIETDNAGYPVNGRKGALDQVRASQTFLLRATAPAVAGWEPMSVDIPGPLPGTHWVVTQLMGTGILAVNANPTKPTSGLFKCSATQPAETLAEGQQTTRGWNPDKRGLIIDMEWEVTDTGVAGARFAYVCQASLRMPLIVLPGEQLRCLVNVNPATAQPGPGAGSTCLLMASGSIERQV